MNFFIIKSPTREIDKLLTDLNINNHSVFVQEAVRALGLIPQEISEILNKDFDLEYSELQIDWRKVEGAEWASAL